MTLKVTFEVILIFHATETNAAFMNFYENTPDV